MHIFISQNSESGTTPEEKRRRKTEPIVPLAEGWLSHFFDIAEGDQKDRKCKKCSKIVAGAASATSNYGGHLRRKHCKELIAYNAMVEKNKAKSQITNFYSNKAGPSTN